MIWHFNNKNYEIYIKGENNVRKSNLQPFYPPKYLHMIKALRDKSINYKLTKLSILDVEDCTNKSRFYKRILF